MAWRVDRVHSGCLLQSCPAAWYPSHLGMFCVCVCVVCRCGCVCILHPKQGDTGHHTASWADVIRALFMY
jgi:hypothetical protein